MKTSVLLALCPLGYQLCPRTLDELAQAVIARFDRHSSIDDFDTSIQLRCEAVSLFPEGHADCDGFLNNLAISLMSCCRQQGKPCVLGEAISLYEKALRLCPVGHNPSLDNKNLGGALITQTINLYHEALMLRPPGHPPRDTTSYNFANAAPTKYDKSHVSEDLDEAIDRYHDNAA
ncbi:hypothetical protein EDD22DRAFT_784830 [Suillus occidentalis]|nr:hypothetical protein EDD22DRAFT_784830 [Suillus occidentalis]